MRIPLICVLFLSVFSSLAQTKYPQDVFRSPMDIPIILAGTFGELRSNHFHAGIDIKTQLREGLPIYGIADGTVTRIKISHWGYGKALYVAHPNGYTSVYAHLQKFSPEIEAYIKKIQYQKKSYEVEVFPDYGELKIKQGDVIAYSGNSGSSGGPHLHFEIRSSVTEKPTNPLLYGYEVRDATNPTLLGLYGYPLENAHINGSENQLQINFTKQKDGSFLADEVTALGTIGFGVNGFDRLDMAANKNGVYSVKQIVNGKVYSEFDFETFSFAESRYINTLIDYKHFGKHRQRIQKLFKEPYNKLSIYKQLYLDGKITIEQGLSYKVEILLADYKGNKTKLIIPVKGAKEAIKSPKKVEKTDNYILANKPNSFDLGAAKVFFPENTFYNDFYIDLKKGKDTVGIHDNTVAAHRNFTISFDVSAFPAEERKQLFIARLKDSDQTPSYTKTYKRGNTFTARTRTFGTYTIAKDTTPPVITPKNFKAKQWLTNYRYLSLTIADDLSGINSYNATINGEWILMEYEPKTRTITYTFDDKIMDKTECNLKVTVTDNVGNTTTLEQTFFRK
ncbi:M23 family metallopeptidase [Flavobacterium sp. ASW18X]|uniref:M23 family metallopeptidase n=1 Tax=Flavobacterium sp. ASW18X TaxID=2572595 RepID=UPI0010AE30E2|nr:M23 family metallopeptidase [Flavobacterium sp. ASW18X]TKD62436.1 M23 family metallopeptidase [Flavobacterium sp. ASW18X]